jgi:deoxyribonuclease-4
MTTKRKNTSTSVAAGPLLGAHMSIAGGVHTAVDRALKAGCATFQMFVKNNNQWTGKPITDEEAATYKAALTESRLGPVVVHDSYLINLCAIDPTLLSRSRDALTDEVERCEKLGVPYLNLHPGSHVGAGEADGIARIAESLNIVHERTKHASVMSVLETTAGQGSAIGYSFEHLRAIIDKVEKKERMGVCIDTCHVFAAGYDISTEKGYEQTMKEFDAIVGFDRLVAFHVNDSKKGLGSRVDRHEHIGKGAIGLKGLGFLMNDERFAAIPKVLETPKSEDMHEDIENLATLRKLIKKKGRGRG